MIIELLEEKFNIIEKSQSIDGIEILEVDKTDLPLILSFLKNTPESDFDMLIAIAAGDFEENFGLDYLLYSSKAGSKIIVRTKISKNNAQTQTVSNIFSSANWEEREIFDLFGITFISHKNLERLFMPKGWIGHPLRKDYKQDDERLVWNR